MFFLILSGLFLLIQGTERYKNDRFPVETGKDITDLIKLRNKYTERTKRALPFWC